MHNAERTEANLNYSTMSGLTPSALDSTCRFQPGVTYPHPLRLFPFLRRHAGSGFRGSLYSLIGGFVFPFLALLLLMPPSRGAT